MTLAPILISFSLSVVSDQSFDFSGKAGGRALFYGTRRSTKWLGEITHAAAALGHLPPCQRSPPWAACHSTPEMGGSPANFGERHYKAWGDNGKALYGPLSLYGPLDGHCEGGTLLRANLTLHFRGWPCRFM
jgi:hypothetical protein